MYSFSSSISSSTPSRPRKERRSLQRQQHFVDRDNNTNDETKASRRNSSATVTTNRLLRFDENEDASSTTKQSAGQPAVAKKKQQSWQLPKSNNPNGAWLFGESSDTESETTETEEEDHWNHLEKTKQSYWNFCYGKQQQIKKNESSLSSSSSACRPPPAKSCLSKSKKRTRHAAFPDEEAGSRGRTAIADLHFSTPPSSPRRAARTIQFADLPSAVEFDRDAPSHSLAPMPAAAVARRFPTERDRQLQEQLLWQETARNEALLRQFDDDDDDASIDMSGISSSSKDRRQRRESFYVTSTSSDPAVVAFDNSNSFRLTDSFRMDSNESLGLSSSSDMMQMSGLSTDMNNDDSAAISSDGCDDDDDDYDDMMMAEVEEQLSQASLKDDEQQNDQNDSADTCWRQLFQEPESMTTQELLQRIGPFLNDPMAENNSDSNSVDDVVALCASNPSLRHLLHREMATLQGHTALLPRALLPEQQEQFQAELLKNPDLSEKLTILARYQWKILETNMWDCVGFHMHVEASKELEHAASALQMASDALPRQSKRSRSREFDRLIQENTKACEELERELGKELARSEVLTHQNFLRNHLKIAVAALQKQATCDLLDCDEDHTDDSIRFLYSSVVEGVAVRVICDLALGEIAEIEVIETTTQPPSSRRNNDDDDDNSIVIPNSHAVGIFYQTLLTVGIATLFSQECDLHREPTNLVHLSTYLGRLQLAAIDLWRVADRHGVSIDEVTSDRLLLSIKLEDTTTVHVDYDLSNPYQLFSSLPTNITVTKKNNNDEHLQIADLPDTVSNAIDISNVEASSSLLQLFCEAMLCSVDADE